MRKLQDLREPMRCKSPAPTGTSSSSADSHPSQANPKRVSSHQPIRGDRGSPGAGGTDVLCLLSYQGSSGVISALTG